MEGVPIVLEDQSAPDSRSLRVGNIVVADGSPGSERSGDGLLCDVAPDQDVGGRLHVAGIGVSCVFESYYESRGAGMQASLANLFDIVRIGKGKSCDGLNVRPGR